MALLGSVRFWMLTAVAFFQIVNFYFPGEAMLWNILSVYLGATAGVGTLDSVATKLSAKVS